MRKKRGKEWVTMYDIFRMLYDTTAFYVCSLVRLWRHLSCGNGYMVQALRERTLGEGDIKENMK